MGMFREILCPVDFSENSVRALQWTEHLARESGSDVIVLHVLEPLAAIADPGFDYDKYRDAIAHELQDFLSPVKVKYESLLSTGYSSEKILALAKGLDASLIVMGTRGLQGATYKFLGSTTESVVRRSVIPVMTISPNCASSKNEEKGRVLLPVSNLVRPPRGFIRIRRIVRELDAFFSLMHVVRLNDEMFDSSFGANPFLVTTYQTVEKKQELAQLGAMMMRSEKALDPIIQFGDAAQEILKEAESGKYDYVVMGAKKKALFSGFVESTLYRVISKSPIPVITIKTS